MRPQVKTMPEHLSRTEPFCVQEQLPLHILYIILFFWDSDPCFRLLQDRKQHFPRVRHRMQLFILVPRRDRIGAAPAFYSAFFPNPGRFFA